MPSTSTEIATRTPNALEIHPERFPSILREAGPTATERYLQFLTAEIRNPNTRRAYARAHFRFFAWCAEQGLGLADLRPFHVATYVELLGQALAAPSVKQHLAALRMCFDYLVLGQVLPFNPCDAVRGPRHVVHVGKTPVLFEDEARQLLDSISGRDLVSLRDRALLSVMTHGFARVGAVLKMRVKDYQTHGRRAWLILHEKGGKFHRVPAHHKTTEYLDRYLEAAGLDDDPKGPLFRAARGGRRRELSNQPLQQTHVLRMVKRRARAAGLSPTVCCHTFRATGITNYLQNGGTLETAAKIAAHASTRTTQLYNRTHEELSLDEIERIRI